jgi:hypothetical protein
MSASSACVSAGSTTNGLSVSLNLPIGPSMTA